MEFLQYLMRIDPRRVLKLLPDRWGRSCNWIVEHDIFYKFLDNQNARLLWLHGVPGSGKTVLTKHVIRYMEMMTNDATQLNGSSAVEVSHCIAFFFCDDKDPLRKTTESVLLSLLYQLLSDEKNTHLFRNINEDFLQDKGEGGKSLLNRRANDDQEKLWETLLAITKTPKTVFWIFIDALDEMDFGARQDLLLGIERVITGDLVGRVKFMLSSRSRVQDDSRLATVLRPLQIDLNAIEGVHKDVESYLHSQVDTFASGVSISVGLRRRLQSELVRVSGGTFLHASLAWATFTKGFISQDEYSLEQSLSGLRQMSTDLESFYCGLLASIPATVRRVARLAFTWVLASYEPLNLGQLCCAISIDPHNHSSFLEIRDEMDSKFTDKITEQCAFLIKVGGDGAVQFAHQSVKDLLLKRRAASEANESILSLFRLSQAEAHSHIAETCLAILQMREFSPRSIHRALLSSQEIFDMSNRLFLAENVVEEEATEFEALRAKLEITLNKYPLLQYSMHYWADHWAAGSTEYGSDHLVYTYITSAQADYFRLAAVPWTKELMQTTPSDLPDIAVFEPPLHRLLQRGDFPGVVRKLLSDGQDVNQLDDVGMTPLHWAINRGRAKSFETLISTQDMDPNRSLIDGPKPIHQAVHWRRTSFIARLLDVKNIDVNSRSKEGWTALHLAMHMPNFPAIDLLLEDHRIDILARDESGISSFELAFRLGHRENTVKRMVQLIDMKSGFKFTDRPQQNPLMTAGLWGWGDVERHIIEHDMSQVLELDNEGMNVLTQ